MARLGGKRQTGKPEYPDIGQGTILIHISVLFSILIHISILIQFPIDNITVSIPTMSILLLPLCLFLFFYSACLRDNNVPGPFGLEVIPILNCPTTPFIGSPVSPAVVNASLVLLAPPCTIKILSSAVQGNCLFPKLVIPSLASIYFHSFYSYTMTPFYYSLLYSHMYTKL